MRNLIFAAATLVFASSCATRAIPDNIPPAPPAHAGGPYTAPNVGGDDEEVEDGFGGDDGFGGETPTVDVPPADTAPTDGADPDEGEEKPADDAGEQDGEASGDDEARAAESAK